MPRLPIYEQQSVAQPTMSTPDTFGAGSAQVVAQQGDILAQIGDRIQRRNEVIDRVRQMNAFEQSVNEDLTALRATEDIADPQKVDEFRQRLRQRREQFIGQHSGRYGSAAEFRAQLENMEGQIVKQLMGEQIKAQHNLIARTIESDISVTSNAIADDFTLYDQALEAGYEKINQFEGVLPPEMVTAAKLGLEKSAAVAMVNALRQRGEVDVLEEFLQNPETYKLLSAEMRLNAQADISKVRYEREERERSIDNMARSVEAVTGNKLTPEQREIIAGLPDPSKMNMAQKMMMNEMILGRPLTEQERQKMMGIYTAETQMTKSASLAMISSEWGRFSSGVMSQQERLQYLTAWQQSGMLPGWRTNEITGRQEYFDPVLPPELDRMRKVVMGSQQAYQPPAPHGSFDYAVEAGNSVSPGYREQVSPTPDYSKQENENQRQVQLRQLSNSILGENQGLYQMADNMIGPDARLKEMVFNLPFIGDKLGIDPTVIEDRQFARGVSDQVIRAYAVNRRFPVAEIQRVLDTYPVGPQTWSNPEAYRAYIRAVDRATEVAIRTRETALSQEVSMDNRRDIMDTIQDLKGLRAVLNVTDNERGKPLKLSDQQAMFMMQNGTLQPGDRFIGLDGEEYEVPDQRGQR